MEGGNKKGDANESSPRRLSANVTSSKQWINAQKEEEIEHPSQISLHLASLALTEGITLPEERSETARASEDEGAERD